jgi:hypothetical protein
VKGPPEDGAAQARRFIDAELAAGNAVVATHAPPAGVLASTYVILARPATTRPREATAGQASPPWCFGSLAPGVPAVVVLEAQAVEHDPPRQPAPPAGSPRASSPAAPRAPRRRVPPRTDPAEPADRADRIQRFRASMAMDLERWRDGTGYDLDAIDEATPAEREAMLDLVLAHGLDAARDVEAVARLGGPRAEAALRHHFDRGGTLHRLAVLREAPALVSDDERTAVLVQALQEVRPFEGLSLTLGLVEDWHPPPVVDALWQAARHGPAERAVHAAALLAWLHGLAAEPFDWSQRPFFLQFGDRDPAVREGACQVLRQRIGPATPVRGQPAAAGAGQVRRPKR